MIGSALKCYPALSSHFNVHSFECTNIRGLCALIRCIQIQLLDQEQAEIERSDAPEPTKQNLKARVLRFQELWRRFRSRTAVS
eukprot:1883074-Pyramimonas_sp.AAC.1